MKLLLILSLLSFSIFSQKVEFNSEAQQAYKNHFTGNLDSLFVSKLEYLPSYLNTSLESMANFLYLNGITTLAAYNKMKCISDEVNQIEALIKKDSIPEKYHCYFERLRSLNGECVKVTSIDEYKDPNKTYHDENDYYKQKDLCSNNTINGYSRVQGLKITRTKDPETGEYVFEEEDSRKYKNLTSHYKVWKENIYLKALEAIFVINNSNLESKRSIQENATRVACKDGLIRGLDQYISASTKEQASCSKHEECQSKVCGEDNKCTQVFTCHDVLKKDSVCGLVKNDFINSYCENETSCIKLNYNSSDINECSFEGKTCSNDLDCCSGKCSAKKCVEQRKCLSCTHIMKKPTDAKPCCPGLYEGLDGKCIEDFPPLDLEKFTFNHKPKNIISIIFSKLLGSAYAQSPNSVDPVTTEDISNYEQETNQQNLNTELDNLELTEENKEVFMQHTNSLVTLDHSFSNPKECKFNTYKDSWKEMPNNAKNAHYVVNAFEYLYSAKPTGAKAHLADYWLDSQGNSIYERAHDVSTQIRKNRSQLVQKFNELDTKMECLCIGIMGPEKFSDRAEFYNSAECAVYKSDFAKLNSKKELIDSDKSEDEEVSQEDLEHTDLGASGIRYEQMLVDYFRAQSEIIIDDHYYKNTEASAQLRDLSLFVSEINPEAHGKLTRKLYDLKVKKIGGFWKVLIAVVVAIVVIVLSIVTFGAFAGVVGVVAVAVVAAGVIAKAVLIASLVSWGLNALFPGNAELHPKVNDIDRHDWKNGNWLGTFKYKMVDRYYVVPHYQNNDVSKGGNSITAPSNKVCYVKSYAGHCLKNSAFIEHNEKNVVLLDPKEPMFLESKKHPMDFVSLRNEADQRGLSYLISKRVRRGQLYLNKYKEQKDNQLDTAYLVSMIVRSNNGQIYAPIEIDDTRIAQIKNAVKKYALCKELDSSECTGDESYKGQLGFGYFFESENDIDNFAEYFLQHHFVWPSLTNNDALVYSLHTQKSYFQLVAKALSLITSAGLDNGLNKTLLYQKYLESYGARRALLAQNNKVEVGETNKRVSQKISFLKNLQALNMSYVGGVAGVEKQAKAIPRADLTKRDLKLLENVKKNALHLVKRKKEVEHYKKTVANTPRGKRKIAAQKSFLRKFSTPLADNPLTIGGQNLGNTASGSSSQKKVSSSSRQIPKVNQSRSNFSSFSGMGFSGSGDDYQDDGSQVDKNQASIDRMLDAAESEKDDNQAHENDTLFTVVTKAYKRNYDKVFEKRKTIRSQKDPIHEDKKLDMDVQRKKLKKLLGQ